MTAQLDFFGLPPETIANFGDRPRYGLPLPRARASDPETSRLAAADAAPRAETHRARALDLLRRAAPLGLTDFELADLTGVAQTSIGVRRGELVKAGLVRNSGRRRPSPSGSAAIVWEAT